MSSLPFFCQAQANKTKQQSFLAPPCSRGVRGDHNKNGVSILFLMYFPTTLLLLLSLVHRGMLLVLTWKRESQKEGMVQWWWMRRMASFSHPIVCEVDQTWLRLIRQRNKNERQIPHSVFCAHLNPALISKNRFKFREQPCGDHGPEYAYRNRVRGPKTIR